MPGKLFSYVVRLFALLFIFFVIISIILLGANPHPKEAPNPQVLPFNYVSPETGPISVIADNSLIQKPANYFNLEGKRLRLTPISASQYSIQVLPVGPLDDPGNPISFSQEVGYIYWMQSEKITMPFTFPFGGTSWTEAFINLNGTISFGQSEADAAPYRSSWADGTMRSVAAAIDAHAAINAERVIAALWAIYSVDTDDSTVYANITSQSLIITWDVTRPFPVNTLYQPLGRNTFQAKLFPNGIIELAYEQISERDGIVGVFSGIPSSGTLLDHVDDPGVDDNGGNSSTVVDVVAMDIFETGSVVQVRFIMNKAIPQNVSAPNLLSYRIFVKYAGRECLVLMNVTDAPRGQSFCIAAPAITTFRVSGNTLDLFISKVAFGNSNIFSWQIDVVLWDSSRAVEFDQITYNQTRMLTLAQAAPFAFITASGQVEGNIFEVFHYPVVSKSVEELLQVIYRQFPTKDDIAIVFTDFRIDDLHGRGGSARVTNTIRGIGLPQIQRSREFGSDQLQISMSPTFIGQPNFAESVSYDSRDYHGYPVAVRWISHEIIHRWAAHLDFINPEGQTESLGDDEDHWNKFLHAPSLRSVSYAYTDDPYFESSPMGGNIWVEKADHTFEQRFKPYLPPSGLSGLDLYVMGLLAPEEVPPTFILEDPQDLGDNHVEATKKPVRLNDIVAAMGPRIPTSVEAQKEFNLSVYLIIEPGRKPKPEMVIRAQGISGAVAKYFGIATAGRMQISFIPHTDLPIANYRTVTTKFNKSFSGTLSASAVNTEVLTYTIFTDANKGTVKITNPTSGSFIYTPDPEAVGPDIFTFKVRNEQGESNVASVTVNIQGRVYLPIIK